MCMEDLRLGRGRKLGRVVTLVGPQTKAPVLPANPNRVALLVSLFNDGNGTPALAAHSELYADAAGTAIPVVTIPANTDPSLFRIEDVGNLITSAITGDVSGQTGGSYPNLFVTEIITSVKAEPIGT